MFELLPPVKKDKRGKVIPAPPKEEKEKPERTYHSPVRKTLATRDIFDKVVAKYGCPIEAMAAIGFDKDQGVEVRLQALKEFASYGHSKLKTVEHTGANGEPLEFKQTIINNILQLLAPNEITDQGRAPLTVIGGTTIPAVATQVAETSET